MEGAINQLFYSHEIRGNIVFFDLFETGHIAKVLRKKNGDLIWVTNGEGGLFKVKISISGSKEITGEILDAQYFPLPEKKLHLFIAPPKSSDRFEWFLEKATELGAYRIVPFFSLHSVRKKLKTERYEKILVSAMKQSLRLFKPKLVSPVDLKDIPIHIEGKAFIALCDADSTYLSEYIKSREASIVIGPEGGFSLEEFELFKKHGFKPVQLAQQRLRTETAGITAVCKFFN